MSDHALLYWRPVLDGVATLRAVETEWSINDLLDYTLIKCSVERARRRASKNA